MARMVRLADIVVDLSINQRADGLERNVVLQYAEDMKRGVEFPPIVCFKDGDSLLLADGFHRVKAADAVGLEKYPANVHEGKRKDAVTYACGANATHGSRRTNADKHKSVMTLLELYPRKSDRQIAELAGVSQPYVSMTRADVKTVITSLPIDELKVDPVLAEIEERMLTDRELIEAAPEDVVDKLSEEYDVDPELIAVIQQGLKDNVREWSDGRKSYRPVLSAPGKPKTYPASDEFFKWMQQASLINDSLLQRFAFDVQSLLSSDEWDRRRNKDAANCLVGVRVMIDKWLKEIEAHGKS